MQSTSFNAFVSRRELAFDYEAATNAWRVLQRRLAEYIAEHLTDAGYQLIRQRRETFPNHRGGDGIELRLTLEVGQVTQRRNALELQREVTSSASEPQPINGRKILVDGIELQREVTSSASEPQPINGRKILVDRK